MLCSCICVRLLTDHNNFWMTSWSQEMLAGVQPRNAATAANDMLSVNTTKTATEPMARGRLMN
jgi:hypothetical protein